MCLQVKSAKKAAQRKEAAQGQLDELANTFANGASDSDADLDLISDDGDDVMEF